jgi:hypothetical protein
MALAYSRCRGCRQNCTVAPNNRWRRADHSVVWASSSLRMSLAPRSIEVDDCPMQHNSPVLTGRRVTLFVGLALVGACSGSPTTPRTQVPAAPALKSVRYVRTLPVVHPDQTNVFVLLVNASASCFGCPAPSRSGQRSEDLR